MGYVLNTLSPNSLVQLRVQSDILHVHSLLSKLYNGLNSPWCSLFERSTVNTLMEVNSIFASDDVLKCWTGLSALFRFLGCRLGFRGLVKKVYELIEFWSLWLNCDKYSPLMLSAGMEGFGWRSLLVFGPVQFGLCRGRLGLIVQDLITDISEWPSAIFSGTCLVR